MIFKIWKGVIENGRDAGYPIDKISSFDTSSESDLRRMIRDSSTDGIYYKATKFSQEEIEKMLSKMQVEFTKQDMEKKKRRLENEIETLQQEYSILNEKFPD